MEYIDFMFMLFAGVFGFILLVELLDRIRDLVRRKQVDDEEIENIATYRRFGGWRFRKNPQKKAVPLYRWTGTQTKPEPPDLASERFRDSER